MRQESRFPKRAEREKAIFLLGVLPWLLWILPAGSTCRRDFAKVYAAESEEKRMRMSPEKNSTYRLDSIMEGVFISQNTQTEVEKLGTSFEVDLPPVGAAHRNEENWLQNWISVTRVPGKWKSFRINP